MTKSQKQKELYIVFEIKAQAQNLTACSKPANKPSTSRVRTRPVSALFVPSCQRVCDKLLITIRNNLVDIIRHVASTDLKIDWTWHLLLEIEAGVIAPTLLYFSITKSHFSRFYSLYTLIININGIKTRKM